MKTKTKMKSCFIVLLIFFTANGLTAQETGKKSVFKVVEVMPEFPGGDNALQKFVMENVQYPEKAKQDSISGRVFVKFVIDQKGKVTDAKVVRGVHETLDKEALRVVKMMPDWKPGLQKGVPVDVEFNIPIQFALK